MRSAAPSPPASPFTSQAGPLGAAASPTIDKRGLILGAGTCLARFGRVGGPMLQADRKRVPTLLSVAAGRAVPAKVLAPHAIASEHWRRGDRALANLRLVFAGLPRLASAADAANVRDAADLLDNGFAPHALMKALGFDAAALDKFDPGQPRDPGCGAVTVPSRWLGRTQASSSHRPSFDLGSIGAGDRPKARCDPRSTRRLREGKQSEARRAGSATARRSAR